MGVFGGFPDDAQGHNVPATVNRDIFTDADLSLALSPLGSPLFRWPQPCANRWTCLLLIYCSLHGFSTIFGTRYAAAPDILLKQPYSRSVDSWGLGVVLYMLLLGQVWIGLVCIRQRGFFASLHELPVTTTCYRCRSQRWMV
jgi:serine/threonine protein kinase